MDIKLQDDKKALKENNVGKRIEDGEFRCTKCEKIVSINDTLDKNIKDHTKKICKHCAILQCDQKQRIGPYKKDGIAPAAVRWQIEPAVDMSAWYIVLKT